MRHCTLTWVLQILMRAISNVHVSRKFPIPVPLGDLSTPPTERDRLRPGTLCATVLVI